MTAARKQIETLPAEEARPQTVAAPTVVEVASAPAETPKRRPRRRLLMLLVPLLLAAGGSYAWLTGGRYVETDNAYVQQPMVQISAEVAGRVIAVAVSENQRVAEGDLLFQVDPEPYRIALAQAEAALAGARLQVEQLRAAHDTAGARLAAAEDILATRKRELERQTSLQGRGLSTSTSLDEATIAAQAAANEVDLARQGLASAAVALGGDPKIETDTFPAVQAALAARDQARRNLARTEVTAPAAGIIAGLSALNPGRYVAAGTPVASLVENDRSWVEANFKETQLAGLTVGQPVEVEIDAYPGTSLHGRIDSIGSATGAEFALIPPQNATGNWVKVVQRLPVRIAVTGDDAHPLRAGMSATVSVDTGASRLDKLRLP